MKQTPAGIIAVRVDPDSSIVALIDPSGPVVRRERSVSGGLRAIDERILQLVEAETPGGLPAPNTPAARAAMTRLRKGIAAARLRLVEEPSTRLPVRFPGRMSFVTLERGAVSAAMQPEMDAIAAAARELGAGPGTRIAALGASAAVPGLLAAIPGRIDAALTSDAYEALVAAASTVVEMTAAEPIGAETPGADPPAPSADPHFESEPVADVRPDIGAEPDAEAEPDTEAEPDMEAEPDTEAGPDPDAEPESDDDRPAIVLRPLWPTIAAVIVILGLGSAGAAIGLGATPAISVDPVDPAVVGTTDRPTDRATPIPAPNPTAPVPSTGQVPATQGGTPTVKKPKAPSTGTAPGTGSGAVPPAPSVPDPVPPVAPTSPPSEPPADPAPDPTPTDPGDDGGSILGIPIPPILP